MNVSYTYDSDGLRTKKTVGSTKSEYYYSGGQLVYEKRGTEEFYYSYNAEGQLAVIQYVTGGNTYTYYPALNIRGDVEALYNESGSLVVQYTYDSWGKIISVSDTSGRNIGTKNPFRYRGYYYDEESGLYYLRSRYYDPEVGRFINADTTDILDVQSDLYDKNLYAYCDNNPINRVDVEGKYWELALVGGSTMAINSGISLSAAASIFWASVVSIAPIVVAVVVVTAAVVTVGAGIKYAKSKSKTDSTHNVQTQQNGSQKNPKKNDKKEKKERSQYPPGKREIYNSRKAAKQAAERAAKKQNKGIENHRHPNSKNTSPHYHVEGSHDHYYYPRHQW